MQQTDKAAARSGALLGGCVRQGGPNVAIRAGGRFVPPGVSSLAVTAISLLGLAAVTGIVLLTALWSPLKDDVAWLLYVAEQWLSGQRLYVDLVEINPPLIIWLSAIPAALADWFGAAPKGIALPLFTLGVLGSAWWCAGLLRGWTPLFANRLLAFALAGIVLIGVAGPELGQREHLLIAGILPYLCLFARAMERERPGLWVSIAVGTVAGLACALKPRYGLVFFALECVGLLWGLRPWRAASLAAAVAFAIYGAAVLLFFPAYLQRAVPLAIALYGATDVSFSAMFWDNFPVLLGEAAVFLLWWTTRRSLRESNLLLVLGIFAVTSTLVCFIDGKNWFYHRIPATVATVLALLCWTAGMLARPAPVRRAHFVPIAVAGAALFTFVLAAVERLEPQLSLACAPTLSTEARVERLIRRERARTYVAFSEWIALGFPVVNNTGVVWASRFDSMWALKGELWRARFDPDAPREWPIRQWVATDFVSVCPDLVVVDTRESLNYIAILSASEPKFAKAWSQYQEIAAFDGLRIFRHAGANHCTGRPRTMRADIAPGPLAPRSP